MSPFCRFFSYFFIFVTGLFLVLEFILKRKEREQDVKIGMVLLAQAIQSSFCFLMQTIFILVWL